MTVEDNFASQLNTITDRLSDAKKSIERRFIGQEKVVDLVLGSILCGGHALLVGVPGLGKTRLVETMSTVMGLTGARVQFTPDLMPADILGSEILDQNEKGERSFRFVEGPVFCQLLMADEINRASPRTQSALLQAMQEKSVTIAGKARDLPSPFHVLATQNPIEQEGTYPLPEAQLDRFLVQVNVEYPDLESEKEVVLATTGLEDAQVSQVFTAEEVIQAQDAVRQMPVGESVVSAILDLVRSCRPQDEQATERTKSCIAWGPGPRAAQALILMVRARALLAGSFAPSLDDVSAIAPAVLRHRMALNFAARADGQTLDDVINDAMAHVGSLQVAA